MIALITVRDVQTQSVVVAFDRDSVVLVKPRRQLDTRVKRDRFPQHGILLAKRFESVVGAGHNRHKLAIKQIVSL